MDIILDEKAYAENAIKNNILDNKKPSKTLKILIKYYYDEYKGRENNKKKIKREIKDKLEQFMSKNYKNYNSVSWQNILDGLINKYIKERYKLINIEKVIITVSELNNIRKINNLKLEKLAFVILVYAKILNQINELNNNWVNTNKNVLAKEALIKDTGKQQKILFKKLKDIGYIEYAKRIDNTNIRVINVDDTQKCKEQNTEYIEITNFKYFVLEYLKWIGEDIKKCVNCGVLIKNTNGKKKYCDECAKKINIIKTIENRKKRNCLK